MSSLEHSDKNALGGLRISSNRQYEQGDSPAEQLTAIQYFAKNEKYNIVGSGEIHDSAADFKQPVLRLIQLCRQNKAQYIIFKNIQRITRSGGFDIKLLQNKFKHAGITLLDSTGEVSNKTINIMGHHKVAYDWSIRNPGETTMLIKAEAAKEDREDLLAKLIGATIHYATLGYSVHAPNYGQIHIRQQTSHGKRNFLEPHPTESKFIEKIFVLKATTDKSDDEIVKIINADGYISRPVIKHSKTDRNLVLGEKGKNKLHIKQMYKYLRSTRFCNILETTYGKGEKTTITKRVAGTPIISVELFNQANKGKKTIFEDKTSGKIYISFGVKPPWQLFKNTFNPNFPYKQVIICPECKGTMSGSSPKGKSGKHFPLYHCSRKINGKHHKQYSVKVSLLHETIENFVKNIKLSGDVIDYLRDSYLKQIENSRQQALTSNMNYEGQIRSINEQKQALIIKVKSVSLPEVIQSIESDIKKLNDDLIALKKNRAEQEEKEVKNQQKIDIFWWYLEHFDQLILGNGHTLQSAGLFGLLFDKLPTYQELSGEPGWNPKLACVFTLKKSRNLNVSLERLELSTTSLRGRCSAS
ncbi:MAG: NUDIX hydrolase [Candidatus Roizmanbacteria bacterium GW2011_GWA2_34_18]|uniref:NUDIX hydrolase n=1 Tax=Candidatus Roizmanbacteria bacterium GW2011_GWA2_34_18 TaxID=1618477 RepID=A0A0G0AU95_9BACT|nr:MAG: NUDIX hydrolase [Candidatus Roizmanbacteria bacterium GW2011_GWA2_34_18]